VRLRLYVTGGVLCLATLIALASMALFTVGMAEAAVPPFDPAGNGATQGSLALYDIAGNPVTSGALSAPPAYALATSDTGRSGDSLATLYAATPQEGVNPILWPTGQISAPHAYPSASAPGTLKNNSHGLATDIFLWLDPNDPDSYAGSFPNTNATASWQKLYQLRILTSGPGQAVDPQRYSSATIAVDTTTSTWTQVFPELGAGSPTVDSPAAVTGTTRVGYTVACAASFTGATSTTYKWFRGGVEISGATASTRKLAAADFKQAVKCRATGTNTTGSTPTTSPAVSVGVGKALVASTNPTISGKPRPGKVLTASSGRWTPSATSYKYQWFRGAKAISGATSKSHKVKNSEVGKKLACRVTAIKKGYADGVKKTATVTVR
jgi:hypothetical protein